jgi:hypothetical protein
LATAWNFEGIQKNTADVWYFKIVSKEHGIRRVANHGDAVKAFAHMKSC